MPRSHLLALLALSLLGCGGAQFGIDGAVEIDGELDAEIEIGGEVSLEVSTDTGAPRDSAETTPDSGPPETSPPDSGSGTDSSSDVTDAPDALLPSTWSASFTGGVVPGAQCTSWNAWRASLSPTRAYTKITIAGSFDPGGVTCYGPGADTLCQALRKGVELAASVICAGQAWGTTHCGGSGGDIALRAAATDCTCMAGGYAARPCSGNADFGGVNGTCPPPSQTISVTCE